MRRIFIVLAIGFLFVLPFVATAQFGPLVPCEGVQCQACHVVELGQRLINFFVAIASFIAVIAFAYAGYLMLTAGGNTSAVGAAKGIFINVIIGLIIVLAGWLIVDFFVKQLFDTSQLDQASREQWGFGPWNEIVCVDLPGSVASNRPPVASVPLAPRTGSGGITGAGLTCVAQTGCSPEALMAATGWTEGQARAMSCIALSESSGNPSRVNTTPQPSNPNGTRACGYFQILPSHWQNPALHTGNCSVSTPCTNAACNIQTAKILSDQRVARGQSRYSDWTCTNCNDRVQTECVNRYDPGG